MAYRGGIAPFALALVVCACDGEKTKHALDSAQRAGAMDSSAAHDATDAAAANRSPEGQPTSSAGHEAPPGKPDAGEERDAGASPPFAEDELSAPDLLQWVLTTIDQHHMLSDSEIDAHFSPNFLSQVPPSQLRQTLAQLADQLPPIHVTVLHQLSSTAVTAALSTAAGPFDAALQITSTIPHRIDSLWFKPSPVADPAQTYQEAIDRLQSMAARAQLYIAEIAAGSCKAKYTLNPDAKLALGSAFKHWVLLALDEKLRTESDRSWDDELTIRDELKSLPTGDLQNQPAGTRLSLRQFAAKMISISDNTAADHLIDFIGRTQVEAAQNLSAHSDPAANIPWLYTRELFALKAWATPAEVEAYRAANVADKRTLLEQLRSLPIDTSKLNHWNTPRMLDLEWFATGPDVCKVQAALGGRGQFDPQSELLKILAINPGLTFDAAQWSYVGFKGGSEPGVLNLSWLLRRRSDGRWFSLVMALNDDAKSIDVNAALQVAIRLAQLLGAEHD